MSDTNLINSYAFCNSYMTGVAADILYRKQW